MQIWQYNIYYINIIVMKNIIISKKVKEKKVLLVGILDTIVPTKMS